MNVGKHIGRFVMINLPSGGSERPPLNNSFGVIMKVMTNASPSVLVRLISPINKYVLIHFHELEYLDYLK